MVRSREPLLDGQISLWSDIDCAEAYITVTKGGSAYRCRTLGELSMARLLRLCGWLLLVCAVPASAHVYDHLYGSGFEVVTDLPASDKEAARFLTQATF